MLMTINYKCMHVTRPLMKSMSLKYLAWKARVMIWKRSLMAVTFVKISKPCMLIKKISAVSAVWKGSSYDFNSHLSLSAGQTSYNMIRGNLDEFPNNFLALWCIFYDKKIFENMFLLLFLNGKYLNELEKDCQFDSSHFLDSGFMDFLHLNHSLFRSIFHSCILYNGKWR